MLERLCANGMLDRFGRKLDPRAKAMREWSAWNPAAGYFHFSTKDTAFAKDQAEAFEHWLRRRNGGAIPRPAKSYPGAQRSKLPSLPASGEFPEVLRQRRTWRKYGEAAVPIESLSKLLKLTFGIQGWVEVPNLGRAAMKTSPSGGDLHPTEAYVMVRRVSGLRAGIYHYHAARHELQWLRSGVSRGTLERNLGGQWWFARAAFLVAMTTVSGRTRWKYDYARAYRALLLEAGHLAQTFCLTATWLGLAPFTTIALKDTKWEEWLGIDGVKESVLYVVGAGTRPEQLKDAHLGALGRPALLK
jgi:SagB-type dehydrogenase family enzyme